jgi:hypothetical protein
MAIAPRVLVPCVQETAFRNAWVIDLLLGLFTLMSLVAVNASLYAGARSGGRRARRRAAGGVIGGGELLGTGVPLLPAGVLPAGEPVRY